MLAHEGAAGIEVSSNKKVADAARFAELGLDPADILTLGASYTLTVTWLGGLAEFELDAPVEDPEGLLGTI